MKHNAEKKQYEKCAFSLTVNLNQIILSIVYSHSPSENHKLIRRELMQCVE